MITNTSLIERLLRYVKIDTQSDEEAASQPSTDKQHTLARLLYKELSEMGVRAYYDIEHCYVPWTGCSIKNCPKWESGPIMT